MSYIKEGSKILLGPDASCTLVTPHLVIPSQYLYEPLGVSGVMFSPTASGNGTSFACEMMNGTGTTISAGNGNEIRIKNGTLKMTDLFSLYEVWKDSPSPWAGAFPRKFNPYDIQPLILSADIKVNKVDSNGQLKFAFSANTAGGSKTAVNLLSGTFPLATRIPISNYGSYYTAYNNTSATGSMLYTTGNASANYFNWTWGGDVDNNEATAWINRTQKARMSFNNKWYAFSGIEAYNCDVTIKDFKLVYFSYDRANSVNSFWNTYSSYYPDGVKPDYIEQKKPVIG